MNIERISTTSRDEFVRSYLCRNQPVVVTDAISVWGSRDVWTGEYFRQKFGRRPVQVYDDLFNLTDICALEKYFDYYWNSSLDPRGSVPYVRWYAKYKDVDFVWSDEIFQCLSKSWALPYFLPESEYVLPYCPRDKVITPVLHRFPGKGLFISAKGARTKLHQDPWASDAVLCQVCGEKRLVMYRPEQGPRVAVGKEVVDLDQPDVNVFTDFSRAEPDVVDTVREGETLFIPAGWFHHLSSLSNSIAITWNFVSMHRCREFMSYLLDPIDEKDRDVLKYFASMGSQQSYASSQADCDR